MSIKEKIKGWKQSSDFHILQKSYSNHVTFKDMEKESGNIRDLIEDLTSRGIKYEFYSHIKDNGCTIFY